MRLVVDTNVLVSALHNPDSTCGKLVLLAIEGGVELFAPDTVREELSRALRRKLRYGDEEVAATRTALPVEWLEKELWAGLLPEAQAAIRDASDAPVIAAALLLGAEVVSSDSDFHPLRKPVVRTRRPKDAARRKGTR